MSKWLAPFLALVIALVPWHRGAGQEAPIFTSIQIDLWPEYDRPEMLVIYRLELSADVPLPAELSIQIPAAAGDPNAVAVRDLNGSLLNAPYEREVAGDWAVITLTASMPGIQIEYYDPQLTTSGSQRSFRLTWQGDYPTQALMVQLQQPFDAKEVVTDPETTTSFQGSEGLTYHTIDFGAQPAGLSTTLTVSYIKDTDALTVERFEVQPSAPISGSTSGRVNTLDVLPWALGVLGILLLVGGLGWYWQTGRVTTTKQRSRGGQRGRRKRPSPQVARSPRPGDGTPAATDQGVYCHQCGKRAESGDRFCRACGSNLRAT